MTSSLFKKTSLVTEDAIVPVKRGSREEEMQNIPFQEIGSRRVDISCLIKSNKMFAKCPDLAKNP